MTTMDGSPLARQSAISGRGNAVLKWAPFGDLKNLANNLFRFIVSDGLRDITKKDDDNDDKKRTATKRRMRMRINLLEYVFTSE